MRGLSPCSGIGSSFAYKIFNFGPTGGATWLRHTSPMNLEFVAFGIVAIVVLFIVRVFLLRSAANLKQSREAARKRLVLIQRMRTHPEEADKLREELQAMQDSYRRKRRGKFSD